MTWFTILRSRAGAVSLSLGKAAGLALTMGVVGWNVYNYATDRPAASEERVRSFSEVLASGGTLPYDTSMNISAGNTQFASAEDIAAQEGFSLDGGDSEVADLTGALSGISVKGSALGVGEDGLGMGNQAAVEVGPDGKPLQPAGNEANMTAAVGEAAAQAAGKTVIHKLGEAKEGDLQRASMARVSGGSSASGGSFGPSASSAASRPASQAARTEAAARMDPYVLSGSMPKGSMMVASGNSPIARQTEQTEFMEGSRKGRSFGGGASKEARSLRDIAVRSSKVAANANRSANEASSYTFLAQETQAGGLAVIPEEMRLNSSSSSSLDFEDDLNRREAGLQAATDDVDNTEQERKAHRTRLKKTLFGVLAMTILGVLSIATILQAETVTPWSWVAAGAIAAILVAAIGLFMIDAGNYMSKYGSDSWSIASMAAGVLMLIGVGLAFVKKVQMFYKKIASWLTKHMGIDKGVNAILGSGASTGMTSTAESFKENFVGGNDDTSLKND